MKSLKAAGVLILAFVIATLAGSGLLAQSAITPTVEDVSGFVHVSGDAKAALVLVSVDSAANGQFDEKPEHLYVLFDASRTPREIKGAGMVRRRASTIEVRLSPGDRTELVFLGSDSATQQTGGAIRVGRIMRFYANPMGSKWGAAGTGQRTHAEALKRMLTQFKLGQ